MKYSENDMATLISEVEAQFSEHLAKAETDKVDTKKIEVKGEITTETKIEKSEKEVEEKAPEVETTDLDYNDEDFAEMDKLYGGMTKSEAEAHYKSVKKAVFGDEVLKTEKTETKIEKSEKEVVIVAKDKVEDTDLKKSNDDLKAENDKLQKSFQELVGQLSKYVGKGSAPKQKAITRIEYIAKTEESSEGKIEKKEEDITKLNAGDISKRLSDKVKSGSLEKADREIIESYYLDGDKNIETIRHLL